MFTTLRSKVLAGFLFILLLTVGLGGYAISSFKSLADVTASGLEQNSESGIANLSMYESLVRMDAAQLRMLTGETEEGLQVLKDEPPQFYLAFQRARKAASEITPAVRDTVGRVLNEVDVNWERYRTNIAPFYNLAVQKSAKARQYYESHLLPDFGRLRDLTISLNELNYQAFTSAREDTWKRARTATFGVLLGTIIALALGVFGSYLIADRVVKPLKNLTSKVKELEADRLNTRIDVETADELGDLAYEFNRLTERLQHFEAMNINQLIREKQKSEAIIASIEDPLLLFDADGKLLLMNHAAEEITSASEATALGSGLWELFRDKKLLRDIEKALEQAAAITKGDEHITPPIVSIVRGGRLRYFRLRIGRIISKADGIGDEQRPIVGVLVFFNDITHFKELDKMKSDFIAKVSHEFRTPLTSMTMSLDILGEELLGQLNAEQHDIIRTSKHDANRLSKLIRDLLTLARLESARQQDVGEETVAISEAVEQLVRSFKPQYQEKGVELMLTEAPVGTFEIAREHLLSIATNLLSNAMKHTPAGGTVTLTLRYDEAASDLVVTVRDTGTGIAPEDQQRIFEKFVQVKPTNTSTPGSVGLGLAIVREIAGRYSGNIDVESELGAGSTFTVHLKVKRV